MGFLWEIDEQEVGEEGDYTGDLEKAQRVSAFRLLLARIEFDQESLQCLR